MPTCSWPRALALAAVLAGTLAPSPAEATVGRRLTLCTPANLQACAAVELFASAVAGGTSFTIGLSNLGSGTYPTLPTAIYSLVLGTGAAATAGSDLLPVPTAFGGATVSDATPWSLFDGGDVLFLTSSGQTGVGDCNAGGPVDGWSQMGTTCAGGSIRFAFQTASAFDPRQFSVLDLQWVGLGSSAVGDYCGLSDPCVVVSDIDLTPVPEPMTMTLTATGLAAVMLARRRRAGREG